MHSDLALASLPPFLTQILHSKPIFSPLLQFLSIFSLFHSDIIYLCLATTSVNIISICPSARPQVNMLIHSGAVSLDRRWKKKHFRKKEKTKACGLPKAIQLVSVVAPTLDKCMPNFFKGAAWLKIRSSECSPNTQFKWRRTLCSTHKPIQTAAEMLLKRQKERWGVVRGN